MDFQWDVYFNCYAWHKYLELGVHFAIGDTLHIFVPLYQVNEVRLIAGEDPSRACEAFLHLVGIQETATLTKERTSVCSSIEESIKGAKVSTCSVFQSSVLCVAFSHAVNHTVHEISYNMPTL